MNIARILEQIQQSYPLRLGDIANDLSASEGVQALSELLRESASMTNNCAAKCITAGDELAAVSAYYAGQTRKLVAQASGIAEELASLTNRPPRDLLEFRAAVTILREKSNSMELEQLRIQESMIVLGMSILLINLLVIFRRNDDLAIETFCEELTSGLHDAALSTLIPGSDILWVVVSAVNEARDARRQRRNSAASYIAEIESYNEACRVWANGLDQYLEFIRATRSTVDA